MSVDNELRGRLALITGASGGNVIFTYFRNSLTNNIIVALEVPAHAIFTAEASIWR
jgi:hypothetical protein